MSAYNDFCAWLQRQRLRNLHVRMVYQCGMTWVRIDVGNDGKRRGVQFELGFLLDAGRGWRTMLADHIVYAREGLGAFRRRRLRRADAEVAA